MIDALERAAGRPVSRETFERLCIYVQRLARESHRQNLVSISSLERVWPRHILDSAQLARFEPHPGASWVDIGSGAGLPGIVLACLVEGPVTLVEPRRLRAQFLQKVVDELALNAVVSCAKANKVCGRFDVITARAVASFATLLQISHHLSTKNTVWACPRGRSGESELAEAQRAWQGAFHVKRSLSDPDSSILVATGVRAKAR